jgi:hypothetical protein
MADRSASILEVTRDIVVAALRDDSSLTNGGCQAIATNIVTVFDAVYEAVKKKEIGS